MENQTPTTPYWQINIPLSQREPICPPFLTNLNAKDIAILSTPDSSYHILTWDEVRAIITANRIDAFQRIPSDLRRYLEYNYNLKQEYGSVMNFVLRERLGWTEPVVAEGKRPFERDGDVKILYNDWPYGIDNRIVHLVVWTMFELEDDPETGDLTVVARGEIDKFVDETFSNEVGKDNVIWFKNWKSLKSIHAVEHFHVMLYDPDPNFVNGITNGDKPLSEKVRVT